MIFSIIIWSNLSQAIDRDEHNTKNSQIRYEIISGNYDKKFGIDEINGKISVIEPLGLFTGLDYDVSSNGDYIDADIRRTSKLHSSGKQTFFIPRNPLIRINRFLLICNHYQCIFSIVGLNGGAINFVDPVITLIVRAYDLGIPSLSSEVPVQIFTTDVSSRTMKFIVNKDPETVGKRHNEMRLEL